MEPWIRDRLERERQERSWRRQPLRIQPPPPEWVEERERERERDPDEENDGRGVWIFQLSPVLCTGCPPVRREVPWTGEEPARLSTRRTNPDSTAAGTPPTIAT